MSLFRNKAPARSGISRRDAVILALFAVPCLLFLWPALQGRTFFWGDLTYLHHPWRALPAQLLQRGTLPLWNPFAYLGMPLAGQMQCAAWYPGTIPFYLLPFSLGLAVFHLLHFWLAGALSFLWLRRLGFSRAGAAAAGAAYMLSGGLVGHLPFLNHVSTLAWLPALFLFARRPLLLALSLAAAFLSGYPQYLAGAAGAAWLLTIAFESSGKNRRGRDAARLTKTWLGAGALSLVPYLWRFAERKPMGTATSKMLFREEQNSSLRILRS